MKSYKRKEYISILILLYTSVTLCNPCVNKTLNAIPYPNDCQTFILCWLSHAYLQTCPNGLFFDIKTNNCQPLVTATCCNMTLPILIIPVPIYQVSSPPINKTNTWPAAYITTQQANSSSTTPMLPTLKPNSTFITSRNQPEGSTSTMSTLWTESSDSSQSSELTLHVTERTEITKRLEPASIHMDVTESTKSVNSSQLNVYTTSSVTTSTEFYNKIPNSTLIVPTDISVTTTPIQSKLWTSIRLISLSGFTLNTTEQTEILFTTPQTSTNVVELIKSEESTQTETQPYVPTSPAFVTSTESSKKMPTSTLMTPTSPSQLTMPIIFTLWSDSTDLNETSSITDYNVNVTEKPIIPTTPLETSNTTTKFIKFSQPNVYTYPTVVSSTDSNINNPSTMASNPPEAITSIISTRWTDLIDTSQSYLTPGFNLNVTDSTKTEISSSQTINTYKNFTNLTESVESNQPTTYTAFSIEPAKEFSSNKSSTTLLIPQNPLKTTISIIPTSLTELSDSNQRLSSSEHTFTVIEQTEVETTILETNSIDNNINKPVESSKTNVYSTSPIVSSTEYSNTRLPTTSTTNLLSIAITNSTLNPLNTEIYASAMTITADTILSSKIFPTITSDSFGTDPQIFAESSTWQPSFYSTINISSSLNGSFFPTIYSTTKLDGTPETSQYYINKTFPISLSTFTEHDTINSLMSSTKLSSNTFSTISAKSQIFAESSTLQPLDSSTTNILSSTKIPYLPTITPTTKLGEPSTITQYSVGNTSTRPSSYFNEATTQERVLKTATEYIPRSITSSPSQFETTNINFILSGMTISSNVSPTVTIDALQTEPQIFTGNSTLVPIFFSTTNIPYNSQTSSHLTLSSTTEVDGLSIIPQHTENSSPELWSTSYTTQETFPKNTENKYKSAVTIEPSISNQQNNLQTDSETYTIQSTVPEDIKSTHSSLSPNTMLFTGKSRTSPTDTATAKPIVTQTRTLPPLPYSPPPCVLATTTQKSTISLKTPPTIQPVVTSTYISPKTSTYPSLSKPVCGFWDKFVFPDGSDCKYYYKCLFGGIRKVSCRYGYEFNPYALKCMPHLEANCRRRKSSKEVLDFLYML